ncbi:MAG TPA: hypothetical protein VIQ02_14455 [Jiangellaceae bacterium]|jgi:hypothetical protein
MMMAWVEALVVVCVVVIVGYLIYALIRGTGGPQGAVVETGSQWLATHYTVQNATRVVVRRVGPSGPDVLDEHVVTEIPNGDSDFDKKFLEAMAQARARAALFESESD